MVNCITNSMKSKIVFLLSLIFVSCSHKVYDDAKMAFSQEIYSVFNSIRTSDTLIFINEKYDEMKFFILKFDSIIANEKGLFMSPKPYKMYQLEFSQPEISDYKFLRENEIFINKDPGENSTTLCIQFCDLYFFGDSIPPLKTDTIDILGQAIFDYYLFESSLKAKNDNDAVALYLTLKNGIVALKTKKVEWIRK